MRKSLLMSAAVLGLSLPAAMAQNSTSATSPPSPNAGNAMPQPSNSVPPGGATTTYTQPGGAVGTTATTPMGTQPGMAPAMGQPGMGTQAGGEGDMTGMHPMRHPHGNTAHRRPMNEHAGRIGPATGGGAGEPESTRASNIDSTDTRGDIAPALPMPAVRGNSPDAYLAAADRALAQRRTGAAQEALERAETRMLDRSVVQGQGGTQDRDPRVQQVNDALQALANRNYSAARQSIQQAMNMHGQGMGQGMGQPGMGQPMDQSGMGQPGMTGDQPGMAAPRSGTGLPR